MGYINLKYKSYGCSKKFEVNMEKVKKSLGKGFEFKIKLNKNLAYKFCFCPKSNICTYPAVEQADSKITNISGLKGLDAINFQGKPEKKTFIPKSYEQVCKECIWDKRRLCKDNLG
jgi:hypothetical protein